MAGPFHKRIDVFYGGRGDDVRVQLPQFFDLTRHFDFLSNPKRLIPFREAEANETTSQDITCFAHVSDQLYGLGKKGGGAGDDNYYKIYEKSGDIITGSWAASTTGLGGANRDERVLIPYKVNGVDFLFLFSSSRYISAYNIDTPAVTDQAYDTGVTAAWSSACAIVTRDDLLLMAGDNIVYRKDGGTSATDNWTAGLTLPKAYLIVDMVEKGDYVYVAVKPKSAESRVLPSRVYIWDKVSLDVTDVIDFGEGELQIIDNIEGRIVGVKILGGSTSVAIKPKLVCMVHEGGSDADVVKELEVPLSTDNISMPGAKAKFKDGNALVFGLDITLDGTEYTALWAFGRKNKNYPWALSSWWNVDGNTAITSIEGAYKLGNYYFVAHNNDGSINRTNDQATNSFRTKSQYISQKIDGSDIDPRYGSLQKRFTRIAVTHEPLGDKAIVTIYMRKNEESAWTTVKTFTEAASSANTMILEAGDISGTDFPNFREGQIMVETEGQAGGGEFSASITALEYSFEVLGADTVANL